jgi:NTE family protein
MQHPLAFVFGGGGARGAMQVGALRALLEAGFQPDLLVGASIGAVNAAFLALHGFSPDSLEKMTLVWQEAASADLLPANYLWLTARTLFGRLAGHSTNLMRDFYVKHGLSPNLRFGDLGGPRLLLIACDLNSGRTALFGQDPHESVLEGVIASSALPPWVTPIKKQSQWLMDGGAVSNLPIEPALSAGAREIIALDLLDQRDSLSYEEGFAPFLNKFFHTMHQRQQDLELALADALRVPVHHIRLQADDHLEVWDFQHSYKLIACGYQITRQALNKQHLRPARFSLKGLLSRFS